MITLRRAQDRQREREAWLTLDPRSAIAAHTTGLGGFEAIEEGRIAPRVANRRPIQGAEIITYVRAGALAYEDSLGRLGVIVAGEFQRMTVGGRIRYSALNASATDWAHVFQLVLRPASTELEADHEQKWFSVAERRGALRVVVSPDARFGSLRIQQDVLLYSVILARGQHVVHELMPLRSAWLQVVDGQLTLGDDTLGPGDGACVVGENTVSLTAQTDAEVLLVDLGEA